MNSTWIAAFAAAVGGILLGALVAGFLRRWLGNSRRPDALQEIAPAGASFAFSLFLSLGLIIALAIAAPDTLSDIPSRLVSFLPNVIVAGLFLIVGRVASVLAATAVGQAIHRASGRRQLSVERAVSVSIMACASLLALTQLGIDATVLNMITAGLIFGATGTFVLLAGLGGRDVAGHIAAGRSLRTVLRPGTRLESAVATGTIVALRPVTIEIERDDGGLMHVPYNSLLGTGPLRVSGNSAGDEAT